jgi:DNA-binding CsgD family transcriptional regulator
VKRRSAEATEPPVKRLPVETAPQRARTVGIVAGRTAWTFADVTPPLGLDVTYTEVEGVQYAVFAFSIAVADDVPLTRTERGVVLGVLRGLSNVELALTRNVSTRTIANQLASIYRKLSIASRAELLELMGRRAK